MAFVDNGESSVVRRTRRKPRLGRVEEDVKREEEEEEEREGRQTGEDDECENQGYETQIQESCETVTDTECSNVTVTKTRKDIKRTCSTRVSLT